MKKDISFVLGSFAIALLWRSFVVSAAEESLVLTTYYPAPYGIYYELQSNKMAVGDTDGNGQLGVTDQPKVNGQLYVARSVVLKPLAGMPPADANAMPGELAYNGTDKQLYTYNGTAWVGQSSSGIDFEIIYPKRYFYINAGTPPAPNLFPVGWTNL